MSRHEQTDDAAQEVAIDAAKVAAADAAKEAERAARARGLTDEGEPFVQLAAGDAYDEAYSEAYDETYRDAQDEAPTTQPD